MAKPKFQTVRGMYDILPEQQALFQWVLTTFERLAIEAGYGRIDTPVVEDARVFTTAVGAGTDIVDKELYRFKDRSDNELAMRPEFTAGIARSFLEQGMNSWQKPVRLYTTGPLFRYDRPQAGRQRQFTQADVEVFGESGPTLDAQVILLARRLYLELGLPEPKLLINSLGDAATQKEYRKQLVDYLKDNVKDLAEIDQERLKTNPLRVLDSKETATKKVVVGAPQILNVMSDASRSHLMEVIEYLDDLKVNYELDPMLVRGFSYATETVFEFEGSSKGSQGSLGGGCRYNTLVEQLGGTPMPGVGFAVGIERIVAELQLAGIEAPVDVPTRVFVASLGEPARVAAFRLTQQLLDSGVAASGGTHKDGIGAQLGRADRLGAVLAVIIGQQEVQEGTAIIRDMATGAQEHVPADKALKEVQTRLKSYRKKA